MHKSFARFPAPTTTMTALITALITAGLGLGLGGTAAATGGTAPAPTLGVQGFARTSTGAPVTDGTYGVKVSLYAAEKGGAPLYTDVDPAVKVRAGLFHMRLGAFKKLDTSVLVSGKAGWIGVSIAGEPELPRRRMHFVAYAVSALNSKGVACSGCITRAHLAKSVLAGLVQAQSLSVAAVTGAYKDLTGKPVLPQLGSCTKGRVLAGYAADGKPLCVQDADTHYDGKAFVVSGQGCPPGKVVRAADSSGIVQCVPDKDTTYDGKTFAKSGQDCGAGVQVQGIDASGKLVCKPDAVGKYDGATFALSGRDCGAGKVMQGTGKDGKPLCVTRGAARWAAEGWVSGTTTIPTSSWKTVQKITLPSAGKYLVISNYRVRRNGTSHAFVKAQLAYPGGSTEARMICEGIRPLGLNFTNYGGSVSWIISAKSAGTVSVQYRAGYAAVYQWYSDGNGVPRPVAIRL